MIEGIELCLLTHYPFLSSQSPLPSLIHHHLLHPKKLSSPLFQRAFSNLNLNYSLWFNLQLTVELVEILYRAKCLDSFPIARPMLAHVVVNCWFLDVCRFKGKQSLVLILHLYGLYHHLLGYNRSLAVQLIIWYASIAAWASYWTS